MNLSSYRLNRSASSGDTKVFGASQPYGVPARFLRALRRLAPKRGVWGGLGAQRLRIFTYRRSVMRQVRIQYALRTSIAMPIRNPAGKRDPGQCPGFALR